MESEAEKIFSLFEFEEEDGKDDFELVMEKFDEYFIPRRNVIHERACFYQRCQHSGESVEMYIRTLSVWSYERLTYKGSSCSRNCRPIPAQSRPDSCAGY